MYALQNQLMLYAAKRLSPTLFIIISQVQCARHPLLLAQSPHHHHHPPADQTPHRRFIRVFASAAHILVTSVLFTTATSLVLLSHMFSLMLRPSASVYPPCCYFFWGSVSHRSIHVITCLLALLRRPWRPHRPLLHLKRPRSSWQLCRCWGLR